MSEVSAEEALRDEKRKQAQEELAAFNEQRKKDLEARRQKNRSQEVAAAHAQSEASALAAAAAAGHALLTGGAAGGGAGAGAPPSFSPGMMPAMMGAAASMFMGGGMSAASAGAGPAQAGPPAGNGSEIPDWAVKVVLTMKDKFQEFAELQQSHAELKDEVEKLKEQLSSVTHSSNAQDGDDSTAVMVRVPGLSASSGFRRVVLEPRSGFAALQAQIAKKFGRDEPSFPVTAILRLSDELEICDDADVELLANGDKLEVSLASQT